jgi:hypothetical protein
LREEILADRVSISIKKSQATQEPERGVGLTRLGD